MKPYGVDLTKVLNELHDELERVDEAIVILERLRAGRTRRGRPPTWLNAIKKGPPKPRKKTGEPRKPE